MLYSAQQKTHPTRSSTRAWKDAWYGDATDIDETRCDATASRKRHARAHRAAIGTHAARRGPARSRRSALPGEHFRRYALVTAHGRESGRRAAHSGRPDSTG